MDKKEYMLNMINKFEMNAGSIPDSLQSKLDQFKNELEALTNEQVEKLTDGVMSTPASESQLDKNHPMNVILNAYHEMESVANGQPANQQLQEVMTQIQGYFEIEEKDGFFP
ncbi:hypothetical protein ACJ2A9_01860 [Anaerobacillus sp. MEB173]|uniref:hypothetical protein n=1 Tax=Anaerobacillus sp. MEB173 TaxID=3383345 RepID=UPI003F8EF571